MTIDTKIKIQMPAMPDFLKANFDLSRNAQVMVEIDVASLTDEGVEQFITEWSNAFRAHAVNRRGAAGEKPVEPDDGLEERWPYICWHGQMVKVTHKSFDVVLTTTGRFSNLGDGSHVRVGDAFIPVDEILNIEEA